jgi:spermidine synthase
MRQKVIIYLAFFLSGFLALTYEVLWIREFTLVFGASALAMSSVLTSYMGGLALGSACIGRIADRIERRIRLYALLEIGIGIFALIFPLLLRPAIDIYLAVYRYGSGPTVWSTGARVVLMVLLLLPPTVMMGGTLPLLGKSMTGKKSSIGRVIGFLYALNTFGGVAGVFFAGFAGIRFLGTSRLLFISGIANIVLGILVLLFVEEKSSGKEKSPARDVAPAPHRKEKEFGEKRLGWAEGAILLALAVSGFASLSYEVLWTRVLSMIFRSNIYAYTIILVSFLLGIALGSWLIANLMRKVKRPLSLLVLVETGIALFGYLSLFLIEGMNGIVDIVTGTIGITTWWKLQAAQFLVSSVLFFIPAFLIGSTLPLASEILVTRHTTLGKQLGNLYAANTLGAVAGAFLTGFLVLPYLGISGTTTLIASFNVLSAVLLLFSGNEKAGVRIPAPAWVVLLLALTGNFLREGTPFIGKLEDIGGPDLKIMYYRSGVGATVTVMRNGYTGSRELYTNGIFACSDRYEALQTVKMLGHLPLLLHENPEDILIIGFGIGVTSSSVAKYPVRSIDCIEIVPDVPKAANLFLDLNEAVLRDERFHLVIDDGRSFILTTPKKYDVISCDPIHPAFGSSSLYTLEYYKLCKERLKEGGIICQYLPFHDLTPDDYRILLGTFSAVFPHTSVWLVMGQTVLMGSLEPLAIDADRMKKRLDVPRVKRDLSGTGLESVESLLSRFLLSDAKIASFTSGISLNSDDNPVLEFSEKRTFPQNTIPENMNQVIAKRAGLSELISQLRPGSLDLIDVEKLTELHKSRGRILRALVKRELRDPTYIEDLTTAFVECPFDEDVRYLGGHNLALSLVEKAEKERRRGDLEEARKLASMALDLEPHSREAQDFLRGIERE